MAARTFQQILSEVTRQSDPQRQTVLKQIADLPNQETAAEAAANAQKDQAYQDILSGAQQRGLGFSGIPLGEQAKYNATTYAPAIANLKSTTANNKTTLESALAGIGSQNYATANDIYGQEQQLALQRQQAAEQQRQFNANLAFQREQAARQSGSDSAITDYLKQWAAQQQRQQASSGKSALTPPAQQQADYNYVRSLIDQVNGGDGTLWSQIFKQAKGGNQRSKDILRAFYQLQNKPIPTNFKGVL